MPDDGYLELNRAVDTITVGRRFRRELGDLDALAESITRLGLLQPITVSPDGMLVCGLRRLAAVRQLGWTTVRVWVRTGISDDVTALLAEQDENTVRADYTWTEAETLYREIKSLLREDAARRQAATQFGSSSDDGDPDESGVLTLRSRDESGVTGGQVATGDVQKDAAVLVTGRQSQTTLERVGTLKDLAKDEAQPPRARRVAVDALAAINRGAPVTTTFERAMAATRRLARPDRTDDGVTADSGASPTPDLGELAAAAIDRLDAKKRGTERSGGTAPAPQTFRHTLRSWVLIWKDLEGWDAHYDPETVATTVSDGEWERFVRVAGSIVAFQQAGQAARGDTEYANDVDTPASAAAPDPERPTASDDTRPRLAVVPATGGDS